MILTHVDQHRFFLQETVSHSRRTVTIHNGSRLSVWPRSTCRTGALRKHALRDKKSKVLDESLSLLSRFTQCEEVRRGLDGVMLDEKISTDLGRHFS